VYDPHTPTQAVKSDDVAVTVPGKVTTGGGTTGPNWALIIGAIAGGVVLVGGIVAAIIWWPSGGVPNVTTHEDGTPMMVNEAVEILEGENLDAEITEQLSDAPAGSVLSQEPVADADAPEDGIVKLTTAMFSVDVPSVVSFTVAAARDGLGKAGLAAETQIEATGNSPGGTVIRQAPEAGSRAAPNSVVMLTVEKELTAVPNLAGVTLELANQRLQEIGLAITQRGVVNTGAQPGTVVAQDPAAGAQVDQGTTVAVDLETARIAVPSVVNQPLDDAIRQLGRAQLIVAPIQPVYVFTAPFDTVSAQDPAANATVPPGTPVVLSVRTQSRRPVVGFPATALEGLKLEVVRPGLLRAAPPEDD
jgi:beta-lactam-binding protein with PASTA domain